MEVHGDAKSNGIHDSGQTSQHTAIEIALASSHQVAMSKAASQADFTNGMASIVARNHQASARKSLQYQFCKITVVELLSTNATSSAFPESFNLNLSASGRWIVACSSCALYLISAQHLPNFKNTCRAFRISRKPLSVAVTDAGRFAVLTTSHRIDVYQCGEGQDNLLHGICRKLETIHLDYEARTLTFSECGEIIAAASDSGVEIKNLSPGCLETDKRQISCAGSDQLMFSADGRSLLATSAIRKSRYSTFISVNNSFEDEFAEEETEQQPLGKRWTTQLLFPDRLPARQASMLPGPINNLMNSEILAFDCQEDRYKVFDVTLKRFAHHELSLPKERAWLRLDKAEEAVPAITADASAVAVAVKTQAGKEIWLYSVPSDWWETDSSSSPEYLSSAEDAVSLNPVHSIPLPPQDGDAQERVISMKWLRGAGNASPRRLTVLLSKPSIAMPEDVVPIETPAVSGKLLLFDFVDPSTEPDGGLCTAVIDLSDVILFDRLVDDVLELDREVDIVRRRTQSQRARPNLASLPSPRGSLRRSQSSGSTGSSVPTIREFGHSSSTRSSRRRRSFSSLNSASEDVEIVPIDEPYSQTQPRSHFSLHRAATIAANAPANRLHLRALPAQPLEYRRADGLRETPHESDADNWVPPPPVYSAEPDNVISHPISSGIPPTALRLSDRRCGPITSPTQQSNRSERDHRLSMPAVHSVHPPLGRAGSAALPHEVARQKRGNTLPLPPLHFTSTHSSGGAIRASSSIEVNLQRTTHSILRHFSRSNAEPGSSDSSHASQSSSASHSLVPTSNSVEFDPRTSALLPAFALGHPSYNTLPSPITEPNRGSSDPDFRSRPVSPTADQTESPHRYSGGFSPVLYSTRTAHASSSPSSVAISELVRDLQPLAERSHSRMSLIDQGDGSSLGVNERVLRHPAALSHMATAPSEPSRPIYGDPLSNRPARVAPSTPEAPAARRTWWRLGYTTPQLESRTFGTDLRPMHRTTQQQGHCAPATVVAASTRSRGKTKDNGTRCVVM